MASDISEVPEEIVQEAVDTTYNLGRQAGRGLVRVGLLAGFGGLLIGAAGGYFFCQRKLETKYNQIAEDEIAEMREHYQKKLIALENTASKGDLEDLDTTAAKATVDDIVRGTGYSTAPPMAVTPPTAVIEAAEEAADYAEVSGTQIPTTEEAKPQIRNVFEEARVEDHWEDHEERAKRSPMRPYVIHYDERDVSDYDESTLTYYAGDDVLCNELDEVIADSDRERIVGEANLEKFGHGSNDAHIVYIRNDVLEAQYEVVKSPNSYAEEVHGFEHTDTKRRRPTRSSHDDE